MSKNKEQWHKEAYDILAEKDSRNSLFRTGFVTGYVIAKEGTEALETQIEMLTSDLRTKLVVKRFSELNEEHKKLIMQMMALLTQIRE